MYQVTQAIEAEVGKVIIGKNDVVRKVLMSILAGGHVLLDDVPGVGKTSLAVALGKTLGLEYNRIQCTPDVLPSDIVGFSVFNKEKDAFTYMPGVINNTNLLLADEINRTSSRTQAALLEAMEEHQVTVDGITHALPDPFIVIATENQVGAAGTQMLPHAQMDRFLVRLTLGYPDKESEIRVVQGRQSEDPYAGLRKIADLSLVKAMQKATLMVTIKDSLVGYIVDLIEASRSSQSTELGISPRGSIAVSHMAKASALMHGRDFVNEEDIRDVFCDVCSHRIILTQKARAAGTQTKDVLERILESVIPPYAV
ncbi:MAG: MoxR family ATPase [Mogibacterium sp.]|nr:MoxR family ATPase [Mogibacterium sp.]